MKKNKIRWMILRLKILTFWFSTHTFLLNEYNFIRKKIRVFIAKRKADQMHTITGKRYHVVQSGKKFIVVDNTFINTYNRLVGNNKRIDINGLLKMSYYSTSVRPLTSR